MNSGNALCCLWILPPSSWAGPATSQGRSSLLLTKGKGRIEVGWQEHGAVPFCCGSLFPCLPPPPGCVALEGRAGPRQRWAMATPSLTPMPSRGYGPEQVSDCDKKTFVGSSDPSSLLPCPAPNPEDWWPRSVMVRTNKVHRAAAARSLLAFLGRSTTGRDADLKIVPCSIHHWDLIKKINCLSVWSWGRKGLPSVYVTRQ